MKKFNSHIERLVSNDENIIKKSERMSRKFEYLINLNKEAKRKVAL
jgi:hypothetical protein